MIGVPDEMRDEAIHAYVVRHDGASVDAEELLACAASDPKRSVEVRDVLARVLDGSRFDEHKPLYGTTLVCGWGSIGGHPVGVLANNGILFSEESQKGAHFVQLANARSIPLGRSRSPFSTRRDRRTSAATAMMRSPV